MTARYKIIGTICIDPQPLGAAPVHAGYSLEHVLLSLAVTDALGDTPAWESRRRSSSWKRLQEPRFLQADLDALAAELQTAWDDLETGAI